MYIDGPELEQQHKNVRALNEVFNQFTKHVTDELSETLERIINDIQGRHNVDKKTAIKMFLDSTPYFEITCSKKCDDCEYLIENECFFEIS